MQMDKLHRWCGMLRKRTLVWGRAEAHSSRNIFCVNLRTFGCLYAYACVNGSLVHTYTCSLVNSRMQTSLGAEASLTRLRH